MTNHKGYIIRELLNNEQDIEAAVNVFVESYITPFFTDEERSYFQQISNLFERKEQII